MSKRSANETAASTTTAGSVALDEDQLAQVGGGIALLLPAIQQAREAARSSDPVPTEQLALNYSKIEYKY